MAVFLQAITFIAYNAITVLSKADNLLLQLSNSLLCFYLPKILYPPF